VLEFEQIMHPEAQLKQLFELLVGLKEP